MRHTFLCCVAALVAAGLVAGCQVPREPVWLPDSGSFIYTNEQGGVLRYDVAKRATETILSESAGKDGKFYTAVVDGQGSVVGRVRLPWPNQ